MRNALKANFAATLMLQAGAAPIGNSPVPFSTRTAAAALVKKQHQVESNTINNSPNIGCQCKVILCCKAEALPQACWPGPLSSGMPTTKMLARCQCSRRCLCHCVHA